MDSSENKNYQRNRPSKNDTSLDAEVQRLFRKHDKLTSADFLKLREKYNDDEVVEKIQRLFVERQSMINKKAKKFAKLIREKYSDNQYPFHILLEKAHLFKTKHSLTDDEFAEFQRLYESDLAGTNKDNIQGVANNMSRFLGAVTVDNVGFPTKLSDSESRYVQEILKLHGSSKPLHAQVLLQSMQYSDCDFEALTGEYKRELGNRPGDSVHPVIAAMFFPKIAHLESHFLQSNFAGLVNARYNNETINTRPDYELFHALITDPNDIVCDNRSPLADLLARAQLQQQLWNCVLNLRNGQYYHESFRNFVNSIDTCRLNKFDNPDLIYGRYDGTIIKRLLSAFSFRPTVIASAPVYANMYIATNPYQQKNKPVVTAVPMINLRLQSNLDPNANTVSLSDALQQQQGIIENGMVVLKNTSIIYSRGVLFFFVDRRANTFRLANSDIYNVERLPIAVSGFERLDTQVIDFSETIKIRGDEYNLRSVVLSEVNRLEPEKNMIVGSSAAFMIHPNLAKNAFNFEYFLYDPVGVSDGRPVNGQYVQRKPVHQIHGAKGTGAEPGRSFREMCETRGTIFMYELVKDQNKDEIAY
jgi:hypothetical protein